MMRPDLIILGAGASGLFCSLVAGRRGVRTALVDHAPSVGRKVCLAGGGRGNFTNLHMGPEWYVSEEPGFCVPVLRRCPPRLVLDELDRLGIAWEEREEGRIFGRGSASLLVEALSDVCCSNGATLLTGRDILGVTCEKDRFFVQTSCGTLSAPRLAIALGGPARPQCGATDLGLRLLRNLGHGIIPPRPALVSWLMPETWPLHGLAGISLSARVRLETRSFAGPVLFTHQGLSGPAILQASCFRRPASEAEIDFLPDRSVTELLHAPENGRLTPLALLRRHLPDRVAERLIPADLAGAAAELHAARWNRRDRKRLAEAVHAHRITSVRTAGFKRAEVAAGGASVTSFHPRTLESRVVPGLYAIGEVLDVTGLLGGYNLHWAWASGKAAAEAWD